MKGLKSCTKNFRFYPHSQRWPNVLRMTVLQDKQGGVSSKAGQDPIGAVSEHWVPAQGGT